MTPTIYTLKDEWTGSLGIAFGAHGEEAMERHVKQIVRARSYHGRIISVLDQDAKVVLRLRGAPRPRVLEV